MKNGDAGLLIDSNVIVAAVIAAHPHHTASARLFTRSATRDLAVAIHSLAETYVTLTKPVPRGFGRPSRESNEALRRVATLTRVLALTPAQTLAAIGDYAQMGGVGARLYDRLIGEVAVVHLIPRIVTWNVRHFTGLFPQLRVVTPAEAD